MEKTASDSGLFCFYLVSVGIGHALSLQKPNMPYTYRKFFVQNLISPIFAANYKPNT